MAWLQSWGGGMEATRVLHASELTGVNTSAAPTPAPIFVTVDAGKRGRWLLITNLKRPMNYSMLRELLSEVHLPGGVGACCTGLARY